MKDKILDFLLWPLHFWGWWRYETARAKEMNHEVTLDEYVRRCENSNLQMHSFSVRDYHIIITKRGAYNITAARIDGSGTDYFYGTHEFIEAAANEDFKPAETLE